MCAFCFGVRACVRTCVCLNKMRNRRAGRGSKPDNFMNLMPSPIPSNDKSVIGWGRGWGGGGGGGSSPVFQFLCFFCTAFSSTKPDF